MVVPKINLKQINLIQFMNARKNIAFASTFVLFVLISCHIALAFDNVSNTKDRLVADLDVNLLPVFRFDRYDIELNEKTNIELLLKPESNIVDVEVIDARGGELILDNNTLKQKGLIIRVTYVLCFNRLQRYF